MRVYFTDIPKCAPASFEAETSTSPGSTPVSDGRCTTRAVAQCHSKPEASTCEPIWRRKEAGLKPMPKMAIRLPPWHGPLSGSTKVTEGAADAELGEGMAPQMGVLSAGMRELAFLTGTTAWLSFF